MHRRQTTNLKPGAGSNTWRVVDAAGIPLGRLASEVAIVLMGKHRPDYTAHVHCGENVVVTNAEKVELTGRKAIHRLKMRYTEYPGGLKTQTYGQVRESDPETLVKDAVRRMLPKNRLSRIMLQSLHVVKGSAHPHANHKPKELKVS